MDRPLLRIDKKLQVFDLLTAASLRSIPTKLSGNAQRKSWRFSNRLEWRTIYGWECCWQPVVISFSYKSSLSQSDRATVAMATNSSLSHHSKSSNGSNFWQWLWRRFISFPSRINKAAAPAVPLNQHRCLAEQTIHRSFIPRICN